MVKLGGDNVQPDQSNGIPPTFQTGLFYHQNCYKKYTKATSVLKRKNENESTTATSTVRRTGELGKILFPKYCMLCMSDKPIKVQGKKQVPKLLDLPNAEAAIREAALIQNDQALLAAIQGTSSLRSAEFRVHEKCRKTYTRTCPSTTKRTLFEDSLMKTADEGDDGDDDDVEDEELGAENEDHEVETRVEEGEKDVDAEHQTEVDANANTIDVEGEETEGDVGDEDSDEDTDTCRHNMLERVMRQVLLTVTVKAMLRNCFRIFESM